MHDYGFFSYDSKADFIERSKTFWNPDKTQFWQDAGVDLVIDRREGYLFWDMEGRRLIDLHLNGGTYNLGHRNRELITTLEQAMEHFDIGNHHFPALARTALAEALVKTCSAEHAPGDLRLGRRRGDRHRHQDRAPHDGSAARSSRSSRATTATPGSRSPPATSASPSCSSPTSPTSSCRCRSTTSRRWRTRCAAATSPPC